MSEAGLNASSTANKFVEISGLLDAGLSEKDKKIFYKRDGFHSLSEFVDKIVKGCHIGLIDGLPGTGKSSTLWWKLRQHACSMVWVHMDRAGFIDTILKVSTRDESEYLDIPNVMDHFWLETMPKLSSPETGISVIVIDGVNHKTIGNAQAALTNFVLKDAANRCGFITMNKIKREHPHQLRMLEERQKLGRNAVARYYHTQHSWALNTWMLTSIPKLEEPRFSFGRYCQCSRRIGRILTSTEPKVRLSVELTVPKSILLSIKRSPKNSLSPEALRDGWRPKM